MHPFLITVVLGLSLCVSFILSGMETGVLTLNRLRLRHWVRQGKPAARRLDAYLRQPERVLWTILVGNVLANFFALSLALFLLHAQLGSHPWLLTASWVLVAFVLYVLFDLLPKMLFRQLPTRLSLALTRVYGIIAFSLGPVVAGVAWLASVVTATIGGRGVTGRLFGNLEELRLVMHESNQTLTTEERSMVNRVLDLQGMTVGGLTVPLDEVTCVTKETPITELLDIARHESFDRLPVKDGEGGAVLGYVSLRTVLYSPEAPEEALVESYLQSALYLRESDLIEVALSQFQRSGQRLAIVKDRKENEIGILTLEDILRHIFGRVAF